MLLKWIAPLTWLLFAGAASAAGSYVQPNPYFDVPTDLAEAANAYDLGRLQQNAATLNDIIADDFNSVDENAFTRSKAATIAEFTDPQARLRPFVIEQAKHTVRTDSAVLAGTVTWQWARSGGTQSREVRYVDVWAKHKGKWEVVFSQLTPIPPPVE
jgi:hypothetical protein